MTAYDFLTLYTTLPHTLIKEKLKDFTEQTSNREGSLCFACNKKRTFFPLEQPFMVMSEGYYILDNSFIIFSSK